MTFNCWTDDRIDFLGINIGTKDRVGCTYDLFRRRPAVARDHGSVTVAKEPADYDLVDNARNVLLNSVTIEKDSRLGDEDRHRRHRHHPAAAPTLVLSFGVRLTDGDNDYADQSFTVSIDGNNDGSITSPVSSLTAFNDGAELAAMSIEFG